MNTLDNLFEPELVQVLKTFPISTFKAGDVLINENDMVKAIPILLDGAIEVKQSNQNQQNTHIYDILPVQSCILSLVSSQKNLASAGSAIVLTDSQVILVPPETTAEWFNKYGSWRRFVLDLYDQRLNELIHSRNLIQQQSERIADQKKEITDSITYAKGVQRSLLQSESQFHHNVPNSFILNKPKDIVSGDFFWSKTIGDKKYFAVADCTGHGVPGAMVSIACYKALDEAVSENAEQTTGAILNAVQNKIQVLFSSDEYELNDGMDISLCVLDIKTNFLSFSGANNAIYRVTDMDLIATYDKSTLVSGNRVVVEYKATRQGIGKSEQKADFKSNSIQLNRGDVLFLTSDGFQDQFGGTKGKKMTKSRMRQCFIDNAELPVAALQVALSNFITSWQGPEPQTDDMLLIGIKI